MSNPSISQLLTLYDIANTAANRGESVSLDDAKDAMAAARTTDLVSQYDEMDKLALFDDDIINKMNDVVEHKHVYDHKDLGVQDNGLRLIAKNVLGLIQHETFENPNTGDHVELRSFEIVQDWRP
jgi:hypothetical protein